jgi:hypothetical protein
MASKRDGKVRYVDSVWKENEKYSTNQNYTMVEILREAVSQQKTWMHPRKHDRTRGMAAAAK